MLETQADIGNESQMKPVPKSSEIEQKLGQSDQSQQGQENHNSGLSPQSNTDDEKVNRCVAIASCHSGASSDLKKTVEDYAQFIQTNGFLMNREEIKPCELTKLLSKAPFSVAVFVKEKNSDSLKEILDAVKNSKTQRCLLVYCVIDNNQTFDLSVDFAETVYQVKYDNTFCLYKVSTEERIVSFLEQLKAAQQEHWLKLCIGSIIREKLLPEASCFDKDEKNVVDLKYGIPRHLRFRAPWQFDTDREEYSEDAKQAGNLKQMLPGVEKNEDKMDYYQRGEVQPTALVINCSDNKGCKIDSDRLCHLFESMQFDVVKMTNLHRTELIKEAEDFKTYHKLWILALTAHEKDGKIECCGDSTVTEWEILEALKNTGHQSEPNFVIFDLRKSLKSPKVNAAVSEKPDITRGNIIVDVRLLAHYFGISMEKVESHHDQSGLVICRFSDNLNEQNGGKLVQALCTAYYNGANSKDVVSLINDVNKNFFQLEGSKERPNWTWLTHKNFFLCAPAGERTPSGQQPTTSGAQNTNDIEKKRKNSADFPQPNPNGENDFKKYQALILVDGLINEEEKKQVVLLENFLAASGHQVRAEEFQANEKLEGFLEHAIDEGAKFALALVFAGAHRDLDQFKKELLDRAVNAKHIVLLSFERHQDSQVKVQKEGRTLFYASFSSKDVAKWIGKWLHRMKKREPLVTNDETNEQHRENLNEFPRIPLPRTYDGELNIEIDDALLFTSVDEDDPPKSKINKSDLLRPRLMILSNVIFPNPGEGRLASIYDSAVLHHLFKQLDYRVSVWHNLNSQTLSNAVKYFSELKDHGRNCVIVIMSHGSLGTIQGVDGKDVQEAELFQHLENLDKQKLVIIQACRQRDPANRDTRFAIEIPTDTIIAHSTAPDNLSARSDNCGSRFIFALSQAIVHYVRDNPNPQLDVISISRFVNHRMMQYFAKPEDNEDHTWRQWQLPCWTATTSEGFWLTQKSPEE